MSRSRVTRVRAARSRPARPADCATWAWRSTRKKVGVEGRASTSGQGGQHRFSDRLRRELSRVGLPGGHRPPRSGPHHPQGVLRLRRQLVRPVRPADPLARADARRARPGLARGPAADHRERAVDDSRHPQPDRPQARPRRRIRRSRAGLRRADVRPARSVGNHPRLGPQRLGDLDDHHRAGYPDRTQAARRLGLVVFRSAKERPFAERKATIKERPFAERKANFYFCSIALIRSAAVFAAGVPAKSLTTWR